ncbi:hypothetical protein JCM10296v2_004325 [Rhodotorula toruloides]
MPAHTSTAKPPAHFYREGNFPALFRNESSAAAKILDCALFGLTECTVEKDFDGSRGNPTPYSDEVQLHLWALIRHTIISLRMMPEEKDFCWMPILYFWEPVQGFAMRESELSHIVFADGTLSRFLLVELWDRTICSCCGKPQTVLYEEFLRFSAQRLLNLITYLPLANKPKWVRATYTTKENSFVPPAFHEFRSGSLLSDPNADVPKPSILHLNAQNVVPMFTPGDLVALNCTILRKNMQVPSKEIRDLVCVNKGEEWTTRWSTANERVAEIDPFIKTVCSGCGNCDLPDKRLRCTACHMVFYCSAECQRAHWPEHKHECMPKKKA